MKAKKTLDDKVTEALSHAYEVFKRAGTIRDDGQRKRQRDSASRLIDLLTDAGRLARAIEERGPTGICHCEGRIGFDLVNEQM